MQTIFDLCIKSYFLVMLLNISPWLQDFNYVHSNALEVTLELSCCKHPPAAHLPGYWRDNRPALLAFMERVHAGVKGVVTDLSGEFSNKLGIKNAGSGYPNLVVGRGKELY